MVWDSNVVTLIDNLEQRLEMIVKWLKGSGLVVNESKTEICLFHTNGQRQIRIKLQDLIVLSLNVFGVIFDSKLTWSIHVANAICKAKSPVCLKTAKKIFYRNRNEDLTWFKLLFFTILQLSHLADSEFEPLLTSYITKTISLAWICSILNLSTSKNWLNYSFLKMVECKMIYLFWKSVKNYILMLLGRVSRYLGMYPHWEIQLL